MPNPFNDIGLLSHHLTHRKLEIRVAARISVEQNQALRRVANAIQSSKSAAMRIAIERGLIEIQEQLNMEQLEVATERTYDDPS